MRASLAGGDGAPGIVLAVRMLRVPDQRTCARISGREQKNVREEERPHMMPAPACVMRPCDVPVRPVRSDHTTQKLRHGFLLRVTVGVGIAAAAPLGLGLFFFMGNEQWRGTRQCDEAVSISLRYNQLLKLPYRICVT